jgi:maltose/moltooligosaccharide transporter
MAQKRLSQLTSFFWHNAAVVGIAMSTTLIFAFATLFLREQIHVSNFLVGVAVSLSHVISVVFSPLVGTLSDRAKTPWGRRRPFLVGGAIAAGAFLFVLPHVFNYWFFLLVLSLFFMFSVGYQIPFYALIPEVAPEGQRGVYATFTGLLRLAGAGLVMGVGGWLWAKSPAWPFSVTAIVVMVTAFITAFSVRDEPDRQLPPDETIDIFHNFGQYLKDLMAQRRIFMFFAAQFFWWMGLGAIMPFATIMLKELYKIDITELMKVTPLVLLGGGLLVGAIVGAGILGDKWGHRRVIILGLSLMAAGCLLAMVGHSLIVIYLAVAVAVIGASPLFNAPFAMMAEMIPPGREGEFYGLDTISITLSQIPASILGGAIIDSFGYAAIYSFVAVCALVAVLLMWFCRGD